jgi:hypothetical protein
MKNLKISKGYTMYIIRSVKDRQYNGQKKDRRTNNDLQNTTEKTKD